MNIITVGCWNKNDCKGNTGLAAVVGEINDDLKKNRYDFMVLLGDNYYPNKDTLNNFKIKNINIDQMKNGFHCFDQMPINKKLIFGNHDVEEAFTNCSILKNQLYIPGFDVKFPFSYELLKTGNELTLF